MVEDLTVRAWLVEMWLTVITQQLGAETLSSVEGGDRTEAPARPLGVHLDAVKNRFL